MRAALAHGKNMRSKRKSKKGKYYGARYQTLLDELEPKYEEWKRRNLQIRGKSEFDVSKRVSWLNEYKDFADQKRFAEAFDSRSRLHSSILEEFLVYLFKDAMPSYEKSPAIGGGKAFSGINFQARTFMRFLEDVAPAIETKDQDFFIGAEVLASFKTVQVESPPK